MFFADRILNIGASDRVLEIGPGGTPHPRSDVFLEKRFPDRQAEAGQRGYAPPLSDRREIVYYDGEKFPFADKAFDYVICSHVLEHVEDVDQFVAEIVRVGRKGYFEFPTVYYDFLYNFPEHKTLLLRQDGVVRWLPKSDTRFDDFQPVHDFFYDSLKQGYNDLVEVLKEFMFQGFEWSERIETQRVHSLESVTYRVDKARIPARPPAPPAAVSRPLDPAAIARVFPRLPSIRRIFDESGGDWIRFVSDYLAFRRMSASSPSRFDLRWSGRHPCLHDRTAETGFDRHYVYHPGWAARILSRTCPSAHIDISSDLRFCAIVSAFVPVVHYDYRPPNIRMDGLTTGRADLMALPFGDGEVGSISCMHVVEHVGLGRYGDPIDPEGDLKAMAELRRVLAPGGSLLFVVPVGKPSIRFNAHRIYSHDQVVTAFQDLHLEEFALVPDDPSSGGLLRNASREEADRQAYGCGCFHFRRRER